MVAVAGLTSGVEAGVSLGKDSGEAFFSGTALLSAVAGSDAGSDAGAEGGVCFSGWAVEACVLLIDSGGFVEGGREGKGTTDPPSFFGAAADFSTGGVSRGAFSRGASLLCTGSSMITGLRTIGGSSSTGSRCRAFCNPSLDSACSSRVRSSRNRCSDPRAKSSSRRIR